MNQDIFGIKGVGEEFAKKLHLLGIETKQDLLWNFPRKYEDYSLVTPIAKLRPGQVTIRAEIKQAKGRYVRRGMHITEAVASDASGSIKLVWFNQPYRAKAIKSNQEYFISGTYELSYRQFSIMNPSAELVSNFPVNTARIIPIYRETKGLKSTNIRKLIANLRDDIKNIDEGLPEFIVKENSLISRADALLKIHFPESVQDISDAKKRLAFEEVFTLVLAALLNKQDNMRSKSVKIPFKEALAKEFVKRLPYKLTNAQRKVVWQIYKDIEKDMPANRLVEGDVGSGKTVVAAMSMLMAMSQNLQTAFMAPTEILARQHAQSLSEMLKPLGMDDKIVLLLGSMKPVQKRNAQASIKSGKAGLIIGTHALISEKVDMKNLGLVIIDEQHRFGVEQRKQLLMKTIPRFSHLDARQGNKEERAKRTSGTVSKRQTLVDKALRQDHQQGFGSAESSVDELRKLGGHMPHLISMTATPIPRSLALTVYGELDVSVIDEMPPGRKPVITKIVSPNSKKQLYEKIDQEIEKGRQMFVVCPLISESDNLNFLSVEEVYKELSTKAFKHRKVGLVHGKLKTEEKERIMTDFAAGKIDILVSTTVIEVGVNVPNATIMLIEGVERFGLAQIHQLRGRIGRGVHQGYCYLMMSDSKAPSKRLRALEQTTDGFKLAELDLELRGPGAIYGLVQHGELDLRLANISDTKLIASARASAQEFLDKAEKLADYPWLAAEVYKNRLITTLN